MTQIDWDLWQEVNLLLPNAQPMQYTLPYYCGMSSEFVSVYLVDGNEVKITYDPDFVEANNSEESSWVKDAVNHPNSDERFAIVDWHLKPEQWPFDLYHELYEMRLMRTGMSYDRAHEKANEAEMQLRAKYGTQGTF